MISSEPWLKEQPVFYEKTLYFYCALLDLKAKGVKASLNESSFAPKKLQIAVIRKLSAVLFTIESDDARFKMSFATLFRRAGELVT